MKDVEDMVTDVSVKHALGTDLVEVFFELAKCKRIKSAKTEIKMFGKTFLVRVEEIKS